MRSDILSLPRRSVTIDAAAVLGPLEVWRHGLGHGGINPLPLPDRVVEGVRRLQTRWVRIFLQEFFQVYSGRGRFDWSRLDPYMEALDRTGAKVVAAITIKPPSLFPRVDHTGWRPADVSEWQAVIAALVRRYSVERPLVTYWEVGNETDIGESGGTPYLIPEPDAYAEFYRMTIAPILEIFPEARVGGPAACWIDNEPLPGLVERCRAAGTRLDFISWHLYSDDPARHALGVQKARSLLAGFPAKRPEMLVTEWNKGFDPVSVEELAFVPRRAAIVAASILAMLEAGLDGSFYYHLWDQVCDPDDFQPFFSPAGVDGMLRHWNEVPHRMGLFGVGEADGQRLAPSPRPEVRPQYFVYQMLSRLGDERIAAEADEPDVRVLAARGERHVAALVVNTDLRSSRDLVLTLQFSHLRPGRKRLTVYRIDAERRWSPEALELLPIERREVAVRDAFRCQIYCPAESVAMVTLADLP
jgi:xylan 1,4-beta-xylosidase